MTLVRFIIQAEEVLSLDFVRNKNRRTVEPIVRLTQPKVLDLLADIKFMVPALVPEKYELISKSQWKVKKCFKLCNLSLNNVLICEIMKLHANYLSIFTSFYVNPAL